ncbi:hypothetical protein NA57DRAFT_62302 [Rhizodiscina lignyota]|uniref:Uncharacterized protein n=1 Tax=Rhizodiscina lignyota TaxID=1504668 RepID=A0A9P4M0R5_9PEZI|nr:hypothetical protein NA57DRAFT_62302 [Rhizodiscina lignyota]
MSSSTSATTSKPPSQTTLSSQELVSHLKQYSGTGQKSIGVNGITFVLPLTGSREVYQGDGSSIVLSPTALAIGSSAADVAIGAEETTLSVAGQTVTVQNRNPQKSSHGSGGLSGLFDLMKPLSQTAGGLASSVEHIVAQGESWAAEQISDADFVRNIGSSVDKARATASSLGNSMSAAVEAIVEEFPETRIIFDDLISLQNLMKEKLQGKNADAARNVLKLLFRKKIVGGGALAFCTVAAAKKFSQIESRPTSATPTTTTESSSTTSKASETKAWYVITSKPGASASEFKKFIEDLDHGAGELTTSPMTKPIFYYLTELNATQVEEIEKRPFVEFVIADTPLNINWNDVSVDQKYQYVAPRAPQQRLLKRDDPVNDDFSENLNLSAIVDIPIIAGGNFVGSHYSLPNNCPWLPSSTKTKSTTPSDTPTTTKTRSTSVRHSTSKSKVTTANGHSTTQAATVASKSSFDPGLAGAIASAAAAAGKYSKTHTRNVISSVTNGLALRNHTASSTKPHSSRPTTSTSDTPTAPTSSTPNTPTGPVIALTTSSVLGKLLSLPIVATATETPSTSKSHQRLCVLESSARTKLLKYHDIDLEDKKALASDFVSVSNVLIVLFVFARRRHRDWTTTP